MEEETATPDEDRDALEAISDIPTHRKAHSCSQRLRVAGSHRRPHQLRNHSLDDARIPKQCYDSSSDFPCCRLDQNLATADKGGDSDGPPSQPLPEVIAAGGDTGVFRPPIRAAVHPNRPPCLELRPHPLRETQVGRFLRTMACTDAQLWAGQECGVRVWNFEDAFKSGLGAGRVKRGDEDAAPFLESANTSPTICLILDLGNRLVFSGHKDGKIRTWKMDPPTTEDTPFKECLSWQAHKGPVHTMVITAYGDLWSGSEGGVIGIWPWESIEKSLSLTTGERHMAALLLERSFVDLKDEAAASSSAYNVSSDVKCLLSDIVGAKVWCARPFFFSLWDARKRKLLKVFNIDGHIGNRIETPSGSEPAVEDEMKQKFVSTSKKEKSHGSNFLQRSRNAILGAAGAVRRAATKSTGTEENRRTEALVQTGDGMIWSGCSTGLLVQWDTNGNRLQDFNHHPCAIQCFCTLGKRIYVGYVSGMVQVMDLEGKVLAGWIAHNSPILELAVGKGYIFSLAAHGGIRGWNIISPGPFDGIIRSEVAAKEHTFTRPENFKILIGTWNVGQGKALPDSLISWLGSAASDVGIVVVGLQEVEMGAGFLAVSAAKETVGLEGSAMGQWWQESIGKALDEGSTFERVGSRQLAGLLVALWVRKNLRTHVGDIDAGAVPCGFGRAFGNKGAVGLRMRVYDRIICFVNCHLAAHLEAVNRRNADFDHVYRNMVFNRSSYPQNSAAVGVSSAAQMIGTKAVKVESEDAKPELSEADMVVFLGDLNYRLHSISYDEARDFVSQRCFDWLREKDQLRAEMKAGRVFQGMREALIRFPPTYKFERHRAGLGGYDSGEKKRIPAWCDRILYRDTRLTSASECSLECPVVSSVVQYEACMDVTESDHKPVRCKIHVEVCHADRSVRRKEFGETVKSNEIIRSMLEELCYVPETTVSINSIILQHQDTKIIRITNKCAKDDAAFRIICEGQLTVKEDGESAEVHPKGSFGFPSWLEVTPAAGVIKPDQDAEVSVHHIEHTLEDLVDGIPQNWWSEDMRDKEVILVVNIQGSYSIETRSHRVHVCHSFSGNDSLRNGSNHNNSMKSSTSQKRSDFQQNSGTSQKRSDLKCHSGTSKQQSDIQHISCVFQPPSDVQNHSDTDNGK